jgi:phenylacetate-CoA ligase
MIRFLHRYLLLPAFESLLKGRKTFRYWGELEKTQWLSRTELEGLQLKALQQLVQHAFLHSPYYHEEWTQRGLEPGQLRSLEDFLQWPIIDGETVRAQRPRLRALLPGMRLMSKSTGGSSGAPVHFDLNTDSNDRRTAAWHRGYSWAGAAPGTKQLYLWGVPLGQRPRWKEWKDRLYNRLQRRLILNSFDLTEERVPEFLRQLNRYGPDVIVAYTNPLYVFARALDEQGIQPFAPKALVVGAEKLHPFQRTLIERVFQAPVFETYGSREFMLIGAECDRHEGLHLTTENLLVEVLDDEGRPTPAGQEGNIVITDLYNYGMPFVRYANGDRAVAGWGTCSCGRGLPLLHSVVGRRLDVLETSEGRLIPGEFFPHLVKDYPAIRRFQVVQKEPDHIELRVVLGEGWKEQSRQALEAEVRKVVGPEVRFDFLPVTDIPLSPAGKLQVVLRSNAPRRSVFARSGNG